MIRSQFRALFSFSFAILLSGICLSQNGYAQTNQQTIIRTQEQVDKIKKEIAEISELELAEVIEQLDDEWQKYERQLQGVLRTRLVEEKEFVAQIALLIQKEQIPKPIVDSAWTWVRKNRPATGYPFVYFERVLRLQAEKAGLPLPAFDRKLYGSRDAMRQRLEQQRLRRR